MNQEELVRRVSELESLNDQLLSELRYLDGLMRQLGFEEGITTLKKAALEILEEGQ